MKNQQKKHPYFLKIIVVIIWSIVAMILFVLINSFFTNDNIIDLEGKKLFGNFILYNGEIYTSVPGNGKYKIPQADIKTFKSISDEYYDKHLALDKNHVYCGNLIIPNLNPKTTIALGRNYYTDGNSTYYCAPYTVSNDSLSAWVEFWQNIRHLYFDMKKPQTYFYPIIKLPHSNLRYYKPLFLGRFTPIITDGKFTYYEGKLMQDAKPDSLVELDELDEDKTKRKSFIYLTDGRNVYFKNQKLAVRYNDSLYSFRLEAQNTEEYVIDPQNGMVYIKNISFKKENAPYKIISNYSSHVYHTVFLSRNGIYFYNNQKKSVDKINENPFYENNYKEIAPLVFYNGKQTLFVDAKEHWAKKYNRVGGLKSRSTLIYKLDENLIHDWQKIGTIKSGTIWKNGSNYFYFDEYGETQLFYHTMYKIKNQKTAISILQNNATHQKILKLIDLKKLTPVKRKEIVEAKTIFGTADKNFFKYKYTFIFLISIMIVFEKKWKKKL